MIDTWDVIVVGGGHAGIEAALAARRTGCTVVLISAKANRIGEMSCNPAIGGIAKGTIVREIDALDGSMARSADATSLHFRMLNRRKGPAVWGPRVQSDAAEYARAQQLYIENSGIAVVEDEVTGLSGDTERVSGVKCRRSGRVKGKTVVLAAGTFLRGRLFRGDERWKGGRIGDISADALERDLVKRMFHVERFKTGTPARIVRSSVNTAELEVQRSEDTDFTFSFGKGLQERDQEVCYITHTDINTMNIARDYLHLSPLMEGRIEGTGPRYCPSYEDKVVKFPDRQRHRIYVEPMGYKSRDFYLNGLSTSLPREAQIKMVRSLRGFEGAEITDYGYAVEYSYFHFSEIADTLRLRKTENVFAAGQICGTSGYEEAAGLGLVAGANAARTSKNQEPLKLSRMNSYIGVMIDDIVSKGADEPYRMFSSRAENRLHLRQDNADRRLYLSGKRFGILSEEKRDLLSANLKEAELIWSVLESKTAGGMRLSKWCRRPGVTVEAVGALAESLVERDQKVLLSVLLDEKYRGYIERNLRRHESNRNLGSINLREIGSYMEIDEICWEAREVLERERPETLAGAERIPGIRPTDLHGLLIYLGRQRST
ncbi:tRNA uridine-5-carboxymethylaminomethyl(34) synthesis enzyme MnmG [Candidatus Fermentibacteria bacterium]|nr:MAG: tRNA uridine-5-carboxymethylaminomethyl(34) synthesis enzyme MnmG [Candidatus Fermentibacteria bacterium]